MNAHLARAQPFVHREGVNRCAACWRTRTDAVHSDVAVHER
jgi:hypothetical protein